MRISDWSSDVCSSDLSPPRYREYAADILSSGEHLLAIIGDILDLSKVEAGKFELADDEFDAGEIMDAAVRLVREKMVQAHLTLDILPPARPVHLRAARRALLHEIGRASCRERVGQYG